MTTNPHPDTPAGNQLMRFTGGVQTTQHQIQRALDFAQEGHWLMALEYLEVAGRTISGLKRVAREIHGEKQS